MATVDVMPEVDRADVTVLALRERVLCAGEREGGVQ